MKNFRSGLIKFLIACAITTGIVYVGYKSMPEIKLGLDLAGGVSITYQSATTPTPEQMGDAVYKMQLKAQDYSTEAEVYQEGSDKINIDIPGVGDANTILSELGEPGNLYFVEGDLVFPEKISTSSEATSSEADSVESVLGPNVKVEGANVIRQADGSITIGGENTEGGTIIQSANNNVEYDYDAIPTYDAKQIVLTGEDVISARGGMYQDNMNKTVYAVDLTFSEEGKEKFAVATEENLGQVIYILYNGRVVSAPTVQNTISDGRAQITGMENLEQAEKLASTIRIGALPIELKELRSNVVGAKLGEEAISTSIKAGAIGFLIVIIFMLIVYRLPGFAADVALIMYIGLMLFLLFSFNITLTLPGIAGIILSIGMAVDANVIIFTRIKEEIGAGKSVLSAVKEGFNKALSAILDGNITTLIAAFVLFFRGTGSIKGFAATLMLGILLSLFTSLFITKIVLNSLLQLGLTNEILFGKKKDKITINFVGFRKFTYAISILLILIGVCSIVYNANIGNGAFNYGLDFQGGSSTSIIFNEELSREEIDRDVVSLFESVTKDYSTQFQKAQGSNQVIVKTRTLTLPEREEIERRLIATSSIATPSQARIFSVLPENITTENISGAVSEQMRTDAIVAVIISTILMLLYIWIRFKDIRFASSAVIALIHDCAITIGFYGLFRWTVDSTFIACMLTIVGYSINATIVIFDRIRENLGRMRGETLKNIVNVSITQTFTRSINTSLTTFIMVICLYILGVNSIRMFALPITIGIVAGTFSSVFITGPLWYDMKKNSTNDKEDNKKTEKNDNVDNIKEEMKLNRIKKESRKKRKQKNKNI